MALATAAQVCTRCVYLGPNDTVMVARSMDWVEDPGSEVWAFDSFATVNEAVAALQKEPFMLPGTNRSADRFARASFYVTNLPQTADPKRAAATRWEP